MNGLVINGLVEGHGFSSAARSPRKVSGFLALVVRVLRESIDETSPEL